jgi:hypothetical protein
MEVVAAERVEHPHFFPRFRSAPTISWTCPIAWSEHHAHPRMNLSASASATVSMTMALPPVCAIPDHLGMVLVADHDDL